MTRLSSKALIILCIFFTVSCATKEPNIYRPSVLPSYAILKTPNISIESRNKTWVMAYNKPIAPPIYYDTFTDRDAGRVSFPLSLNDFLKREPKPFTQGSAVGAKIIAKYGLEQFSKNAFAFLEFPNKTIDILVNTNNGLPVLYGQLTFFTVSQSSPDTSAKNTWTVAIPQQYIDIAHSGGLARIYQPYLEKPDGKDNVSWSLYLSSTPFKEKPDTRDENISFFKELCASPKEVAKSKASAECDHFYQMQTYMKEAQ